MNGITLPLIIGELDYRRCAALPHSRRQGCYLEVLIEEKRGNGIGMAEEVKRLERELRETQAEVARLSERQAFTDLLLEEPAEPSLLPRG